MYVKNQDLKALNFVGPLEFCSIKGCVNFLFCYFCTYVVFIS